jgi:DNA-binding NtrC family response regulator
MPSILVIENDAAVGQLFETALRTAGYDMHLAGSAAEGYEILRRISVEMVITDINMPSGAGLEIISMVRHDFPDTKIVGISREASEFDPVQAAPLLNTVEMLSNPFRVDQLLDIVHRVLKGCE